LPERENNIYSDTADTDVFLDRANPSYFGGILEMATAGATRISISHRCEIA
jgi:hypothetical protein